MSTEDLLWPVFRREASATGATLQRWQARHQIRRRRGDVVGVGELVGVGIQVVELLHAARVLYVLALGDAAGADGADALVGRRVVGRRFGQDGAPPRRHAAVEDRLQGSP